MTSIDRDAVSRVVGRVLFNNANYPERVQPYILGEDTSLLRALIVNAIIDEVQPAAGIALTPEVAKHRELLAHDLRVSATVIAELGGFGYEARAVRLRSLADALEASA